MNRILKKLTIIFTTTHADTLGNACRLEMVDYIAKHFNTTILTNRKNFIENRFPKCKVVEYGIEKLKYLPFISNIFEWIITANSVNKIESDLIFMFDDSSPVALFLNQPVIQYIHQYGERTERSKNSFKSYIIGIVSRFVKFFHINGLKKSKKVFVVSKPIIELLQLNGVSNLVLIPHANDLSKFNNPLITNFHNFLKSLKEDGFFIVTYTGWVTENRGYQLMMDSINELLKNDKKIVLVIAGADLEFCKRISEFQKNKNLGNNIINLGVIDVSLIPGILYYSDICLSFLDDVPAYRISPPQKIIEYFAAGKPVICNKIETHEWLVENGKTGYVLDKDSKQITEAILKLKNDKKLYQTMSENALVESKKYDINIIYGKMVDEMKKVIEQGV